jgi:hypothetical protein
MPTREPRTSRPPRRGLLRRVLFRLAVGLALFGRADLPAAAPADDRGDRIARVWQIRERLKSRLEEAPVEEEGTGRFDQAQWPNWRNYWPNWPNWNNWQNWNNWLNWRNW